MDSTDLSSEQPQEKERPIPCGGHWTYSSNGDDFDCDYGVDFACEDCIFNWGTRDPRVEGDNYPQESE